MADNPAGAPRQVKPDHILEVLEDRDRDEWPVMSVSDVAEEFELDVSKPTVRNRLYELEDEGRVASAHVGPTTVFWPAEESTPGDHGPQLVADGGEELSPTAEAVAGLFSIHPQGNNERDMMNRIGKNLTWGAGLASVIILYIGVALITPVFDYLGAAHAWVATRTPIMRFTPEHAELALGLMFIGALAFLTVGFSRIFLFRLGWYEPEPGAPPTADRSDAA